MFVETVSKLELSLHPPRCLREPNGRQKSKTKEKQKKARPRTTSLPNPISQPSHTNHQHSSSEYSSVCLIPVTESAKKPELVYRFIMQCNFLFLRLYCFKPYSSTMNTRNGVTNRVVLEKQPGYKLQRQRCHSKLAYARHELLTVQK